MGLRWEYLGPWHEQNNQEGSFDAATGKIALPRRADQPAGASWCRSIINQDDYFPAGILKKDLNNWGPRVGVVYNLNDRTVVRSGFGVYYDNLNLNELQFTRLVPPFYGQYSLQPTGPTLRFNADTLFPDLNNIPQFPAPFSMDPDNRTAYTLQWNVNVQRSLRQQLPARGGVHRQPQLQRAQALQHQPGAARHDADRDARPVSGVPVGDSLLVRCRLGAIQRACRSASRSDTPTGCSSSRNYQLSREPGQRIRRDRGERHGVRVGISTPTKAMSRYDQRHRGAFSFGYELPFGDGQAVAVERRRRGVRARRVAGAGRHAAGERIPVHRCRRTNVCQCGSFVPQRVNFAPGREERPRRARRRHGGAVVRQDGLRPAGERDSRARPDATP